MADPKLPVKHPSHVHELTPASTEGCESRYCDVCRSKTFLTRHICASCGFDLCNDCWAKAVSGGGGDKERTERSKTKAGVAISTAVGIIARIVMPGALPATTRRSSLDALLRAGAATALFLSPVLDSPAAHFLRSASALALANAADLQTDICSGDTVRQRAVLVCASSLVKWAGVVREPAVEVSRRKREFVENLLGPAFSVNVGKDSACISGIRQMIAWANDGVDDSAKRRAGAVESKEDAAPLAVALPRITRDVAENMLNVFAGAIRSAADGWPAQRLRVSYVIDGRGEAAGVNELLVKAPMRPHLESYGRGQGVRVLSIPSSSTRVILLSSRVATAAQPYFEACIEPVAPGGTFAIGACSRCETL